MMNAGGRFLGDTANSFKILREFVVDKSSKIATFY
jgi:hypothetical protein